MWIKHVHNGQLYTFVVLLPPSHPPEPADLPLNAPARHPLFFVRGEGVDGIPLDDDCHFCADSNEQTFWQNTGLLTVLDECVPKDVTVVAKAWESDTVGGDLRAPESENYGKK